MGDYKTGHICYLRVMGMRFMVEIVGLSSTTNKVEVMPVSGDRTCVWVDHELLSEVP